ncbi:c-type cytochrome biogenesis protein CcsB [Naumannella halotolerans]|uniref:Cytochrome c-type biogenesis protein CcsB n=1 Tax=Naumannella halotolerans TaxID=993414 RepID=A0A4R7J106_9ACTN|nr:c-type cytochrome biogenesis protein CcsB [Naumannella halotolerans]TDT29997.1 cytochrome c-type biogenesis protein CcsB [Naumannella halotolerans]
MSLSELSYLSTVSAAVVFLFATMMHAAEWATATVRRQSAARGRQLAAATAGAKGAEVTGVTDSAGARPSSEAVEVAEEKSSGWGRMGLGLSVVGTGLIFAGLITRGMVAERLPLANMFEFTSMAMGMIAVAYLVANLKFGMTFLGLPVTLLETIGLGAAVTWFYVDIVPLIPALQSAWFNFHISAAAICAAAFNLAAIVSILYLVRRHHDNRVAAGTAHRNYLDKLPSTQALDRIAYWCLAFAFPLWTFTITAGAIWAQYAWGRFWGWDPKETWSLVTWVIYACYLHARLTAGWRTIVPAVIAIIGAISFWFNFVGINLLVSGLHSYAM